MPQKKRIIYFKYGRKVVRSMKQYEVLIDQELFPGSDVVRGFTYKKQPQGTTMPFFGKRIVLYAAHHLTG